MISVATAGEVENQISDDDMYNPLRDEVYMLILAFGAWQMKQLGTIDYDVSNSSVTEYLDYGLREKVKQSSMTTKAAITAAILEGLDAGESQLQIELRVSDVFKNAIDTRSTIAGKTEATSGSNFAMLNAMVQANNDLQTGKQWVSILDDRTRSEHRSLNGVILPLGQPFKIASTGDEAQYPGGFSSMDQNYNCRCALIPSAIGGNTRSDSKLSIVEQYISRLNEWDNRLKKVFAMAFRRQMVGVLEYMSNRYR